MITHAERDAIIRCALDSYAECARQGRVADAQTTLEGYLAYAIVERDHATVEELVPFIGTRWVLVRQRRKQIRRFVGSDGTERQILSRELRDAEIAALAKRAGVSVGFALARINTAKRREV